MLRSGKSARQIFEEMSQKAFYGQNQAKKEDDEEMQIDTATKDVKDAN